MAKGYNGFISDGSYHTGFSEGGSTGMSGGYGLSDTDADMYLRWFHTRDNSIHVFFTYLNNTFKAVTTTKIWLKEGSFDLSTDWDSVNDEVIGYSNVRDFNLSEGDFYDTFFGLSSSKTYSVIATLTFLDDSTWLVWSNNVSLNTGLSTPSISYNESNKTMNFASNDSGTVIVEFERTDGYNPTGKSSTARNLFYLTSMVNLEGGYSGYYDARYTSRYKLNRWNTGTHTIGVTYTSDVPSSYRSTWYNRVSNAVSELNSALSGKGVSFSVQDNTSGDITITIGDHYDLWGFEPSYQNWYNGSWQTYVNSSGYIYSADIKLRWDESWHQSFEAVTLEELVECLGCGYDQVEIPDNTIFSEFIYLDKPDYISSIDQDVIDILYGNYVEPNMTPQEVAVAINPSKGYIAARSYNTTIDMSFLRTSETYRARTFVVQYDDDISLTSNYMSFTTPSLPPFAWTYAGVDSNGNLVYGSYKQSGLNYYVHSIEWNGLIDYIEEKYSDNGWSLSDLNNGRPNTYPFNRASSGEDLTADTFNQIRFAIGSKISTGITERSRGDTIYASYFNVLKDKANQM